MYVMYVGVQERLSFPPPTFVYVSFNPRRACAARVTVVIPCVCVSVHSLVPRPFVKYKRTRQRMRVSREKGLVNNYENIITYRLTH